MRPTAYSGIRSSLAALPVPKEKDATPRAYREGDVLLCEVLVDAGSANPVDTGP
ncbi:hypothetical protein D3C73_1545510 [compost metagenome]